MPELDGYEWSDLHSGRLTIGERALRIQSIQDWAWRAYWFVPGYRFRFWEDNIKIKLKEMRSEDDYWITLAQYQIQWRVFVCWSIGLLQEDVSCL
jgi:hypothetical protein